MAFQKNFAWGVATASYQIEGAAYEADKGLNVWDMGSRTPGRIFEGHSGDVGCDHYHKFREDVALMKQLGIKAYRLSINWARLIPAGTGKISEDGKRFYLALLDELKKAGIEPWITLFHWDYPYALYQKGGWLNPESPLWFEEYAKVCTTLFAPYCDHFILINEPQCFVGLGHESGAHAPFLKLPVHDVMVVAHNVLLACGRAEKVIRKTCPHPVMIGTAQAYWPSLPQNASDYALAERDTFSTRGFGSVSYFTDPLIFGKYPEDGLAWQKENGFTFPESDMEIIRSKVDFYGFNTYSGDYVTEKNGELTRLTPPMSTPKTDMRWNVHPDALYYGPKFLWDRYHLPVVCTENGVALAEWKDLDGEIKDYSRIDFLKRYLRALSKAADEGVQIAGYFHWSFIDNFEWAEGASKKFGLLHVDYDTLERTPKASAYYYKKVIETNGEEIFR